MKDVVDVGELIIEHYPTDEMWGEFLIKPFQGSKFRTFRSAILGKSRADEPSPKRSVLDPKVTSGSDVMGEISKLTGDVHEHTPTWKIKVRGN